MYISEQVFLSTMSDIFLSGGDLNKLLSLNRNISG